MIDDLVMADDTESIAAWILDKKAPVTALQRCGGQEGKKENNLPVV